MLLGVNSVVIDNFCTAAATFTLSPLLLLLPLLILFLLPLLLLLLLHFYFYFCFCAVTSTAIVAASVVISTAIPASIFPLLPPLPLHFPAGAGRESLQQCDSSF